MPARLAPEVRDWEPAPQSWIRGEVRRRNDRYMHLGFVAAKQAVRDSGLDMAREDGDRVGVIIGSGIGGMQTYTRPSSAPLWDRGPRKSFTVHHPLR